MFNRYFSLLLLLLLYYYITSPYIPRRYINECHYFCVWIILNQRGIFPCAKASGSNLRSNSIFGSYGLRIFFVPHPHQFRRSFFVGKEVSVYLIFCRHNCTSFPTDTRCFVSYDLLCRVRRVSRYRFLGGIF